MRNKLFGIGVLWGCKGTMPEFSRRSYLTATRSGQSESAGEIIGWWYGCIGSNAFRFE